MSILRQLAATHLPPTRKESSFLDVVFRTTSDAAAAQDGGVATAFSGVGLDLVAGEYVIVSMHRQETPKGYDHQIALAITNQRTILGGYSSAKGKLNQLGQVLSHDHVFGAMSKTGLVDSLKINNPGPEFDLSLLFHECKGLAGFYQALAAVPPHQRIEPGTPSMCVSDSDPAGVGWAQQSLWFNDQPTQTALSQVHERYQADQLSLDQARDLVGRITLLHRMRMAGPAAYGHAFLSPLHLGDFIGLIHSFMGPPASQFNTAPNVVCLDYPVVPGRDPLGPGLKALGIASYVGLGVGFSPGRMIAQQMLKKQPIGTLRIACGEVVGGTSYELFGGNQRLERNEALMAWGVHQGVIHGAGPWLGQHIGSHIG